MAQTINILALNAGSNTLRYKVVAVDAGGERTAAEGAVDHVKGPAVVAAAERAVAEARPHGVDAIAYRVVHGGDRGEPERVTPKLIRALGPLVPLAPLHMPTDLALIESAERAMPGVPGVAVYDTAFHRTLPEVAWRYALPDEIAGVPTEPKVRRYGFHGIAHRAVTRELYRRLGRGPAGTKVVSLHLGGGASACAVVDGRSVDTSMGMTPLEGLVMSTRCGDVDPGVLIYLLRQGVSVDGLEELLARHSGLLGLSGRSGDIRDLEPAAAAGDARATLALDAFGYRVRQYVGAYAAAMNGLDAVVVAGALGENSPTFRERVLTGLDVLGVRLDPARNAAAGPTAAADLGVAGSPVALWMVPADEETQMAREAAAVLTSVT